MLTLWKMAAISFFSSRIRLLYTYRLMADISELRPPMLSSMALA